MMVYFKHLVARRDKDDPVDVPDSPALSGVISDLIFTFTPDYAGLCPAFSNCFCPNLSGATELYRFGLVEITY